MLLDTLLRSATDFVQCGVLLSVDLAAGLMVCAPRVVSLLFERPCRTLAFELLRQSRRQASGSFRILERVVKIG
ncbi:MAG: hypothetical protein EPO26_13305 [Chloroflexota bacterium]|nr:MAG: hypothetical protein EPO26_13305 [Chloroflexota bacterium]